MSTCDATRNSTATATFGIVYTEAARKFKKDARKSSGALKEFWDIAFEEGRKSACAEEISKRQAEAEATRKAVVSSEMQLFSLSLFRSS